MTEWLQVIASGGIAVAILLAIVAIARDTIAAWLQRRVQHTLDIDVERRKVEFQHQTDRALERLRNANEQQLRAQATIVGSAAAGQAAALTMRLEAIQALWKILIMLREKRPLAVRLTEFMTDAEIIEKLQRERPAGEDTLAESLGAGLEPDFFGLEESPEHHRVLVGEYLWSLFAAYKQFISRVNVIFEMHRVGKGKDKVWRRDEMIVAIAGFALDADEMRRFGAARIGGVMEVLGSIEALYIRAVTRVLSGELTGNEMAETARRLMDAAGGGHS